MTAETSPPPAASILRIEMASHPDSVEVRLIGEMDLSTRGELEAALSRSHLDNAARVRVDLTHLDFCDATGVAELIAARSAVVRPHRAFAMHSGPPHIRRLLRITGTADVLEGDAAH